jgi:thiamine biosynthesis lipoprotein
MHRVEHVMGMPVSIDVRGPHDSAALDRAFAWLGHVDRTFSTYRVDSEITRIDRETLAPHRASPEVRDVLALCERARRRTGGFFDARATGRLDPSGLVKGWAVEAAARILTRAGARRCHINAGGDVVLRGESPWRVGIRHPLERDALACVLELGHGAVATSGRYERGTHIIDPTTRRAPHGVLSVTVFGPNLTWADAYATAAFAMGPAGPAWSATLAGYEAMTILDDGRVLSTPGFVARCPGGSVAASLDSAPEPQLRHSGLTAHSSHSHSSRRQLAMYEP